MIRISAILRRHRKTVAVVLLFAIAIGPYLASRMLSPWNRVRIRSLDVAVTANNDDSLHIVAYNIAHGRGVTDDNWAEPGSAKPARIARIGDLLVETNADVVILNEVDFSATWSGHQNQAEAIARRAGFPYWVEQRNLDLRFVYGSWKFGNAILSKYPIVNAQVVEYPAPSIWESWLAGHKRGVVCTLQISPSQRVRVLAVHLDHLSERVRVESARKIVELAQTSDIPLIAAGDFNSTPLGFPHSNKTRDGETALGVLLESGLFHARPITSPDSAGMTFSSTEPSLVIDWILIPRAWRFVDYRAVNSKLSDHRPVAATLRY